MLAINLLQALKLLWTGIHKKGQTGNAHLMQIWFTLYYTNSEIFNLRQNGSPVLRSWLFPIVDCEVSGDNRSDSVGLDVQKRKAIKRHIPC